jgi:crotonobetainyl-CoA:carnitine CoA-transferase CaiB-like acyl-CoA transferase
VGLQPDPRFATNRDRVKNRTALDAALAPLLASRTTGEWLRIFNQAGVPASAIQTAGQVFDDPQLAALGQMSAVPGMDLSSPLLPLEFSGASASTGQVPRLGEHTRQVLIEAGFAPHEIELLTQRRIVEWPHLPKSSD